MANSLKKLDDLNIKEKIDFIKIDVEGNEKYVILGGIETIKKNKPIIWVETWEENSHLIVDLFKKIGYKFDYLNKYNLIFFF
ncbi:MAG: FkbM family methyltransferase [SAR202 cluster bacterium]|nr:FkbM family methyltransferase [SAR202 cluster bacterium]